MAGRGRRAQATRFNNHALNSRTITVLCCAMELLVFFECQVRGVKFYDLREAGARWGTSLRLVKEPSNLHDPLCVAAWVPRARPLMFGHVVKEAARRIQYARGRVREIARDQLREYVRTRDRMHTSHSHNTCIYLHSC